MTVYCPVCKGSAVDWGEYANIRRVTSSGREYYVLEMHCNDCDKYYEVEITTTNNFREVLP
jgi:hypothetical protein